MRQVPKYKMTTESGLEVEYKSPRLSTIKKMQNAENDGDLSGTIAAVEEMVVKVVDGHNVIVVDELSMEEISEIFLHWTNTIAELSKSRQEGW